MLDQTYAKLWFDRTLIAPYFPHEGKIEFMVLVSLMVQLLAGRANLQLHYLDQYLTSFLSSISEGKIEFMVLVSLMVQLLAGRANLQLHYLDQYLTSFLSSISEGKIRIQIQQTNSEPDL